MTPNSKPRRKRSKKYRKPSGIESGAALSFEGLNSWLPKPKWSNGIRGQGFFEWLVYHPNPFLVMLQNPVGKKKIDLKLCDALFPLFTPLIEDEPGAILISAFPGITQSTTSPIETIKEEIRNVWV